MHPADEANRLERLDLDEARARWRELAPERRGAVLSEFEADLWPEFLAELSDAEVSAALKELPHNLAADLLNALPEARRSAVLSALPAVERAPVASLSQHAADTAGGIMSDRFIALSEAQTVSEAQTALRARGESAPREGVAYLYVLDATGKLSGVLPVHELVFRAPDRRIAEIMITDVKHVWVDDDQEKVAQLFEKYHYMALPVLERDGRMAGIVLASQVIDVVKEEATEDMQLMIGLSGEERVRTPWLFSVKKRLPWLILNLGTAFLAAAVVGMFEETIAAWTALAIFLPIVAGQGGNAGVQSLTIIIRDMALGELAPGDGMRAFWKESIVGLVNGIATGILVGIISYIWKGSAALGVVVGLAMVLNMLAAAFAGVGVPYFLKAIRVDPALASSIVVTTVTDVAGFFFFLWLASMAMQR